MLAYLYHAKCIFVYPLLPPQWIHGIHMRDSFCRPEASWKPNGNYGNCVWDWPLWLRTSESCHSSVWKITVWFVEVTMDFLANSAGVLLVVLPWSSHAKMNSYTSPMIRFWRNYNRNQDRFLVIWHSECHLWWTLIVQNSQRRHQYRTKMQSMASEIDSWFRRQNFTKSSGTTSNYFWSDKIWVCCSTFRWNHHLFCMQAVQS